MLYDLKAPILGFENVLQVHLEKIDEMFSKMSSPDGGLNMALVNPYVLREYSFTVPKYVELLLELDKDSKVEVYCVVILQKDLQDSMVNFLAPLIFNPQNHTAAQIALSMMDYPDFGFRDTLKSFIKQEVGA
ncbi:flagellar biosynthesis protein FliW [Helicobacter sp. 12S02232-10]|uniref:flagellar assembly protein FliW n=1 Tax=Helicobacter sp. 12S02232-10 TaxID=1476197 RepID=UPI000BA57120|nr:flagellar assembly protein FliW [Helicobacter sp. 12S02232-10]PAF46476.1 flagellar biosynthesis protein FliW [Helicobacter sp. 12S02232-10]